VGLWFPLIWIGVLALAGIIVAFNFPLYRFFFERGGLGFSIGAVSLHFSYFFYSSLTFGLVWIEHFLATKIQKASVSYGSTGD
jgi:hypothetical protein